jgi:CYTH domain-containing protein
VRLRRRGARCWLTVKRGEGLARDELEVELSPEQFEALWPATDGRRLEKVRRVIPSRSDKLAIELDVYLGRLEGLAVAEVEFASEAAAAAFQAPGWFGDEVTDDPEYRNRRLATAGHDPGAA